LRRRHRGGCERCLLPWRNGAHRVRAAVWAWRKKVRSGSCQHNQTEAAHVSQAAGRAAVRASQRRDHRVRAAEGTPGKKNITTRGVSESVFSTFIRENKKLTNGSCAQRPPERTNRRCADRGVRVCGVGGAASRRGGGPGATGGRCGSVRQAAKPTTDERDELEGFEGRA